MSGKAQTGDVAKDSVAGDILRDDLAEWCLRWVVCKRYGPELAPFCKNRVWAIVNLASWIDDLTVHETLKSAAENIPADREGQDEIVNDVARMHQNQYRIPRPKSPAYPWYRSTR